MGDRINLIGYHATSLNCVGNILENGFKTSSKKGEWLGFGVYFWDNLDNAEWWIVAGNVDKSSPPAIITAELSLPSKNFLDLDVPANMDRLREFANDYNAESSISGNARPDFKGKNQLRNFYCSLFKELFDIKLIKFTFSYTIYNLVGFPTGEFERVQLCASDSSVIHIIDIGGADCVV
ncbi:hypothetical protein [Caproiciproducens faecalis]|uniref:Uncharacterized protein n=1 Tax=Caproiciproducens faecalis TaxID=2820301 RepID=A0ABS7DSD3_9FIRM|nr:hypothetical protein [Caproiciproducens faecalis]MBW7573932.1 hypothetical protein [Caproiciproducens faecalis]